MKRTLLGLGLVLATSSAALAYGPSTPGVDYRQYNQSNRIHNGVRDGSLNRHETGRLTDQQRRIQAYESYARADGRITPYERATLARMQREASREIFRQRHDVQRRPGWYGWR